MTYAMTANVFLDPDGVFTAFYSASRAGRHYSPWTWLFRRLGGRGAGPWRCPQPLCAKGVFASLVIGQGRVLIPAGFILPRRR